MRADFSLRAIAVGVAVGAVGAVSNVYVSLKVGWSLPVMTTAAVVGLAVSRSRKLAPAEAIVLTALASSAAFMTGGGNVAAIPALVMLGEPAPNVLATTAWFACTAILGTLLAPLLGQRVRALQFPTATATATLVSVGSERSSRSLWISTAVAAAWAGVRALAKIPPTLLLPGRRGGLTFGVDTSLLLVGVGGLMTKRTAWSTLFGGALAYAVIAPALGLEASYRSMVRALVWPAAALLVSSALAELAFEAPKLLQKRAPVSGERAAWWPLVVPALVAMMLERFVFGLSWIVAIASLPIAVALAYVSARSMGETDVVPTKALAPLAQGVFGALESGVTAPTIAPNLTGAVAIHAADTLGSMKASALLGVAPRIAIVARVIGCAIGAVVVTLAYRAIVPDARALPTTELPSPGILVWKSVSEVIASGALPALVRTSIVAGAAAGVLLTTLDRLLPEKVRAFIPSAMGLGSGMVLPFSSSLAIAIGALVRAARKDIDVTVASGAVAGESLVGVLVQLLS